VIYLTRIHQDFEGSVKYPKVDGKIYELVERRDVQGPIAFSFLTYSKRKV
jgi:dihydrofolate reductase